MARRAVGSSLEQMRMRKTVITLLLGLTIGLGFGGSWRLLSSAVEAAPQDIQGSPDIAVDTYLNSKGSFVLMSDGTIFAVKDGTTAAGVAYTAGTSDLGHPYSAPPGTASITSPTAIAGKVKGSPNVAVKALVRNDATYVVFADGSVKKPANSDAAAAGGSGQRIISGSFGPIQAVPTSISGDGYTGSCGGAMTAGGPNFGVNFQTPFTSPPNVVVSGTPGYTVEIVSYTDHFTAKLVAVPGSADSGDVVTGQSSGNTAGMTVPQISFAAIGN
jgi:hypothetical protein